MYSLFDVLLPLQVRHVKHGDHPPMCTVRVAIESMGGTSMEACVIEEKLGMVRRAARFNGGAVVDVHMDSDRKPFTFDADHLVTAEDDFDLSTALPRNAVVIVRLTIYALDARATWFHSIEPLGKFHDIEGLVVEVSDRGAVALSRAFGPVYIPRSAFQVDIGRKTIADVNVLFQNLMGQMVSMHIGRNYPDYTEKWRAMTVEEMGEDEQPESGRR